MTSLGKIAAIGFAAAGTSAAASVAWVSISRASQTGQSRLAASRPAPDDNEVTVCVASDSVLRAIQGVGCPPGETRVVLDQSDASVSNCDNCDPSTRTTSGVGGSLASLERRLVKLEQSPPFEVVDRDGNSILVVEPGNVAVYNGQHTAIASIRATGDGGWFTGRSTDGALEASLGVSGTHAGLWVSEDGAERVEIGRKARGNYALEIRSRTQAVAAVIGESYAGTGAVLISDGAGRVRTSLQLADGRPLFSISSRGGAPVATLRQNAAGTGMLEIGDAMSQTMVKMDVNKDRYGAVLAGPVAGLPLVTGSGLPGSYILGCAGGDACRP